MSTIKVKVSDQRLVITEAPKLASGGNKTNFVAFEFDESWDNYAKTAVFYVNPAAKVRSPIGIDNICTIPTQVIKKKGTMRLGVTGVIDVDGESIIKTSEVVPYNVDEGASTEGADPVYGKEEYWDKVLKEIAKCETAVKDAIAQVKNVYDASMQALETSLKHKKRHSKGGEDEILPSDIGAAEKVHRHSATEIDELLPTEYDEEEETLELGELFQGDPVPYEQIRAAVESYFTKNPPEGSSVDITGLEKQVDVLSKVSGKVANQNGGSYVRFWFGTEAEYKALGTAEPDVLYCIFDESTPEVPADGMTPAILGVAVLGRTILGVTSVLPKLSAPTVALREN